MTIPFADSVEEINVIETGLFIDKLTGIGGIPRGVISEIWGDDGIGKTTVCLQIIANAQRQGLRCLFADVEYSFSAPYAASLGVDNSKLGLIRHPYAEATLEAIELAILSDKWDLIILDSIGGITPRAEIEKGVEGKVIGGQAGLIAKFCRRVVPNLSMKDIALVVINHSFTDIMSGRLMTSGGRKLAYHRSLSIRFKAKQGVSLKQGDRKVGKVVIGEVRKNKMAGTEGLELDGQIIFGTGFSAAADLMGNAIDAGVITKKGNTYWFGEEKLGIGMSKVRGLIETDLELTARIKSSLNPL